MQKIQQLLQHLAHTMNEYGLGLEAHHTTHFYAVQAHKRNKSAIEDMKKEIDSIKNVLQLSEGRAKAVDAHARELDRNKTAHETTQVDLESL